MEPDKIPQDIRELMIYLGKYSWGHYDPIGAINNWLDERTAHTVVSTDVEQMAKDAWNKVTDVQAINWNNTSGTWKAGYTNGYNAAIQSQSAKIAELEEIIAHQGRSILARQEQHFQQIKELQQSQSVQPTDNLTISEQLKQHLDSITPEQFQKEWNEISQNLEEDVQPTGSSVREIAKREYDKLIPAEPNWEKVRRSVWDEAYDSAAANLPVDNGWTDDSLWDAYHKGYSDGHSDGVLYDMEKEDKPMTQSYTNWLEEYKQQKDADK